MDVQTLLKASMRLIGVIATGETPEAAEMQDGLETLNLMLGSWSAKRMMIPVLTAENFPLVAGTASYTIGSGATFDTKRPIRIESAFIRDSSSIDTPIEIIYRDKYNAHVLKTTQGRPEQLFYEDTYPTGTVFVTYVPDEAYTLFINSWKALTQLTGLTTSIDMPNEYLDALKYNLAIRIAPEYGVSIPEEVAAIAKDTYDTLKTLNAPDMTANFDASLLERNYYGYGNRSFNINTG